MTIFNEAPLKRAEAYCRQRGLEILDPLAGSGNDGSLFLSNRQSYLKSFERPPTFALERKAYERLRARGVVAIHGHNVPQLVDFDDKLGVIEVSVVIRPFLLDFGKVRLDQRLEDFWPAEILAERWTYWETLFEPQQWPIVLTIFYELGDKYGIWLEDIHRGNIGFVE